MGNKKKVYIGGKMTGLTDEESQALFERAETMLTANGYKVINPWKIKVPKYYSGQLLRSLKELSKCDAIYLLENWLDSNGAKCEYWFARGMGIEVMFEEANFDYKHNLSIENADKMNPPMEFTLETQGREYTVRAIKENTVK